MSDLVMLDTSVGNSGDRLKLSTFYSSFPHTIKGTMLRKMRMTGIYWMQLRRISLSHLNLQLSSQHHSQVILQNEAIQMSANVFRPLKRLSIVSESQSLIESMLEAVSTSECLTDLYITFQYRVYVPRQWIEVPENMLPVNLRILSLKDCYDIHGLTFAKLLSSCACLEELSITRCDNITNSAMQTVIQSIGRQLRRLAINKCKKITRVVSLICAQCTSLEELTMVGYRYTPVEWLALATNSTNTLTSLSLRDIVTNCHFYMNYIAEYRLQQLRTLSLSTQNYYFPPVDKLILSCPQLAEVDFSAYSDLRCITVTALVRQAKGLLRMNLSGCDHVSGYAVDEVLCHAESLTHLNISNNAYLTMYTAQLKDNKVNARLTVINISHCVSLSTFGVTSLMLKCSALRMLFMLGCEQGADLRELHRVARENGRDVQIVAAKKM